MNNKDWFPISTGHDEFIVEWSPKSGQMNLRVKRKGARTFLYMKCPEAKNAYGYAISQWREKMEGGE